MRHLPILLILLFLNSTAICQTENLGEQYIQAWKKMYPSKAVAQGMNASIFEYDNLSETTVQIWIDFNKKMQQQLEDASNTYVQQQPIDARLLKNQIGKEVEKWEVEQLHQHSLTLYTGLIKAAIEETLQADFLTQKDKDGLVCQRLIAVQKLCFDAILNLKTVPKKEVEKNLTILKETISSYQLLATKITGTCSDFNQQCLHTADAIRQLIIHLQKEVLPAAVEKNPLLGTTNYNRKLALYTDSPLTADQLSAIALEEIDTVRKLIGEVSIAYFKKTYADQELPSTDEEAIKIAFADMEADAPKNGADYLQFWQELTEAAIQFIEEKQIATLPAFQTLQILPAPESAGPAARIGWVASAPPFAANPITTLYLPSIPDTLSRQEQIEFWSSFNKPFNRMIVIHELFPGHYMQIKISRATPHRVRLLFPYSPYFEGWATFAERVCLDKGWEQENPLTFLAHLRKRLENANRAYTSVQVHCNNWTPEQVLEFSTTTSLLAPQFAKSLWGRIMRSPMQLTSYFWGGKQFTHLLEKEKTRLGNEFDLKNFMDIILKAGAIPMEAFSDLMVAEK